MYIVKVTLHNYRGYGHEEIPITPGLNTIIGKGDSGKSALLKGIRWCLYNEKQGNFINKNIKTKAGKVKSKEEVYVQIEFNTGQIIRRTANSSPNNYYIGHVDTPFEEWGDPIRNFTEIPPEVEDICKLASINIGAQFDSHFLLASKSGDIAKELNKMVNLEIIDSSVSNINSLVNKAKKEKDSAEILLKSYEVELESYGYLEAMEKALVAVEEAEENLNTLKSSQCTVLDMLNILKEQNKKNVAIEEILKFKPQIERYNELSSEVEAKHLLCEKISSSLSEIRENENICAELDAILDYKEDIKKYSALEEKLNALELKKTTIANFLDLADVDSVIEECDNIIDFKKRIEGVTIKEKEVQEMDETMLEVEKLLDTVEKNTVEIERLKKEVADLREECADEVCPTCGNPIGEHDEIHTDR